MKKIFFILSSVCVFLFFGCSNMIDTDIPVQENDIAFTIGADAASFMRDSISKNNDFNSAETLRIDCEVIGLPNRNESKTIKPDDIEKTKFLLKRIPVNKTFKVKINIIYKNSIIFQGVSEDIKITKNSKNVEINILVGKNPCKIKYELNNNGNNSDRNPNSYYVDSQISIDEPTSGSKNLEFRGWYASPDFSGEKITHLGSDNFLGNVTLYAKWVYKYSVTEVNSQSGDNKVTLSWRNPTDVTDFSKVIISCPELKDSIEVQASSSPTDINLPNGKKYNLTIKSVNKDGFESDPLVVQGKTWYALTEDVEVLPDGYVLFGDFPQAKGTITSDEIASETDNINNTSYCMGKDGCYYKYVVEQDTGKGVYYKVEPIKWRVITDNYKDFTGAVKGKLLMSEYALDAMNFYTSAEDSSKRPSGIYANNYKYSNIRAYLNDLDGSSYDAYNFAPSSGFVGFKNGAFTKTAQNKLEKVLVDNSLTSTGLSENKYICDNTEDYVFLMSYKEMTNSAYGFNSDGQQFDPARNRKVTDYSKDKLTNNQDIISNAGNTDYWLRSPSNSTEAVRVFIGHIDDKNESDGERIAQYDATNGSGRIVPAIVVNF